MTGMKADAAARCMDESKSMQLAAICLWKRLPFTRIFTDLASLLSRYARWPMCVDGVKSRK